MYNSRILGTGSYLPEKVLTNADLEKMVDTNDAWILERTGIRTRHIAAENEHTSDLAYQAALKALSEAHISASEVDAIIVATFTPDQVMPTTACELQAKLKCNKVAAFDLSAACTGFIYALTVADQFVRTGMYKNILVVGGEVIHPFLDYTDRSTCILFGDGAGAVVLGRAVDETGSQIYSSHLAADGELGHLLMLAAGGSKKPFSQKVLDEKSHFVQMKGREVYKHAVRSMSFACQQVLDAADIAAEQVSWVIPHQANIRIIEGVAEHFGISLDKVVINIEHTGNTSAATIPIALDEAIRDGRVRRGQNLLLTAFGAGLTSGSLLLRY